MTVHIACEKCDKPLKIPESVVGDVIKCPVCGSVFKAAPEKVRPGKAAPEKGEHIVPARNGPFLALHDDGAEDVPAQGRNDAAEKAKEVEEPAQKGRRGTPWYVMLPLLFLSLCGAGLAGLWTIGFSYLDMDRGLRNLTFDTKVWIGVAAAGAVTLLCLIFSLSPARAWLRFLLVLFLLAVGYGGSFAVIHWWNSMPFVPPAPVEGPYPWTIPTQRGGAPGRGAGGGRGGKPAPQGRGTGAEEKPPE